MRGQFRDARRCNRKGVCERLTTASDQYRSRPPGARRPALGARRAVSAPAPALARDEDERRALIETFEPYWEGNQVWLILGGGAVFAAWPYLYAAAVEHGVAAQLYWHLRATCPEAVPTPWMEQLEAALRTEIHETHRQYRRELVLYDTGKLPVRRS